MARLRAVGVEEEYLLLDPATGLLVPAALEVIAGCRRRLPGWIGETASGRALTADVKPEFFLEQIEASTPPCATIAELAEHLIVARSVCAEEAAKAGVTTAAMPLPLIQHAGGTISPDPRYAAIRETYGELAAQSLMCALHVHVQADGPAEAVEILDDLRPWLPVLLALSANSPYFQGVDTGYASWRSRLWEMWPSSGPHEEFGSVSAHDEVTERLVRWGSAADRALLNFGARRSATYGTVEVRVADACTDVRDGLLLAALVRGLVETAARGRHDGRPRVGWRTEELRAASWHAARYGLSDTLIHPQERQRAPVGVVLTSLLKYVEPALDESGDLRLVATELERLMSGEGGAERQRAAFSRLGSLTNVALDLADRTRSL